MASYEVIWRMTEEDINSPQEAVENSWNRLMSHKNDWIWEVEDNDTGQKWEVDCDVIEGAEPFVVEIKEI